MVFLSSNTSLYFLCPPPRGLFLVKSSPAGELSYYTKKGTFLRMPSLVTLDVIIYHSLKHFQSFFEFFNFLSCIFVFICQTIDNLTVIWYF